MTVPDSATINLDPIVVEDSSSESPTDISSSESPTDVSSSDDLSYSSSPSVVSVNTDDRWLEDDEPAF